jgi:hypothetical protein
MIKQCKNKKYKGMRPPKCNGGKGCETCWKAYNEKLDKFIELIRRS